MLVPTEQQPSAIDRYKAIAFNLQEQLFEARNRYLQPLIDRSVTWAQTFHNYRVLALTCASRDDVSNVDELVTALLNSSNSLNDAVIPLSEALAVWLRDEASSGAIWYSAVLVS